MPCTRRFSARCLRLSSARPLPSGSDIRPPPGSRRRACRHWTSTPGITLPRVAGLSPGSAPSYGLAVWSSSRRFAVGVAIVGLTDLLPVGRDAGPANWDATAFGFAFGTVAVMLIIRRIVGDRDRRARLAERERDVAAREAVVEERARIARELHDAIAHNVSMMVVQAGAERKTLDTAGGPTHDVLLTIENIGRGALTEMRRLVGMLRTDSPVSARPATAPGRPDDTDHASDGGRPAGRVQRRRRQARPAVGDRVVGLPDRAGGSDVTR